MSYFLKIEVEIKTQKGTFFRVSDAAEYDDTPAATVTLFGGLLAYPDLRVTRFRVYSSSDGATYFLCRQTDGQLASYRAKRSSINNIAYAEIGTLDLTDLTGNALESDIGGSDRDPNRVLVSETFAPHDMPASQALYTAPDDGDAVIRFEANTQAVSEGQFGFAPLIVLGKKSVQALELGDGDVLFTQALPIAQKGVVGRYAACNANGLIFMASADGIWTLSPQISSSTVSAPLHAFGAQADILDELGADTALTYVDDHGGNKDVWVGTSERSYVLATGYGRWFTVTRPRGVFYSLEGSLYGYRAATGHLTEEVQGFPGRIDWEIQTTPITLGWPGVIKRLYRLAIRQRSDADYPGGMDQVEYVVYDPLDENQLGGADGYVAGSTDVVAAFHRLVAIGTLTVDDADTLTIDDNATGYVIDEEEGTLVAAGIMQRLRTSDVADLHAALMRDATVILRGAGKAGQGIESIDVDFEPRLTHRARRRNY